MSGKLAFLAPTGLLAIAVLATAGLLEGATPHSGWQIAQSAQDLVSTGYWTASLYQEDQRISVDNGSFTVTAGKDYYGSVNVLAPQLKVSGDFGMVATINISPGGSGLLTLTGSLNTGPLFWQGLKQIVFGMQQGSVVFWYYGGTNSDPAGYRKFSAGPFTGDVNLEVLRQGTNFVFFANGTMLGQAPDVGIFANGNAYISFTDYPGVQMTISGWAMETPQGEADNVQVILPDGKVSTVHAGDSLGSLAALTGRMIGVTAYPRQIAAGGSVYLNSWPLSAADPTIRNQVAGNWSAILDDFFFWGGTEPAPDQFKLDPAEFMANFAAANGMPIHGTALVSNFPDTSSFRTTQNPAWLLKGGFTREQLIALMQSHLQSVVGRFKGRISTWDVVDEPFNQDGTWRTDNPWPTVVGAPDYLDMAFKIVHQIDPSAKLFVNEWNAENAGPKADAVYNLVRGMLARGVPIDGVGMESHFFINGNNSYLPKLSEVKANMKRLADLGLKVRVSELDARIREPVTSADLQTQAQAFVDMATACLESANCVSLNTWETNDSNSAALAASPGFSAPTLFDANFQPKPAYHALMNVLRQAASAVTTAPKLTATAVANAASYASQAVAPGEIVTLFPANVGPASLVGAGLDSSGRILTQIGGTRVLFDGIAAPMIYAVNGQVAAVVPYEVAGQSSTAVQVEYNGLRSIAVSVPVVAAVPGIFTVNSKGTGQVVALNQDGTLNSASNPAPRGTIGTIYATGEGVRNPPGTTGALSGANEAPLLPVTLTVDGVAAQLAYAASAPGFTGLMQVNFTVPETVQSGAAASIILTVGGARSAPVTLAVKQ